MGNTKRRVIASLASVMALAILVPMTASASGNPAVNRAVASKGPAPLDRSGAGSFKRVPLMKPAGRSCDLTCTQRALVALIRKHNKLVKQFNRLAKGYYNCEKTIPVTRYSGYDYGGGTASTTALDLTAVGSAVTAYVLIDIC